ncbi:MAG TPA: ABC transporter permease [Pseudosphingobacterium sp.]|nr:ABC transporter permease [Pseudosphingobacterium sp.]
MLKNYLKIAWRNLWKHKMFSLINIVGLGIAIPFALLSLIQVVVVFENDNFHPYQERTYRIITDITEKEGALTSYASSPFTLAENIKKTYPFIEQATTVCRGYGWQLENNGKRISVNPIYVEPQFFQMFTFPLDNGTFSEDPNTMVLSHEMAKTFFRNANPIGKTLTHPDYGLLTVTGVLKPYKRGTHFRSDAMVSIATYKKFSKEKLDNDRTAYTYVLVRPGTADATFASALNTTANDINRNSPLENKKLSFRRQPLPDISPDFENLQDNPYTEDYIDILVNLFMAIGIVLLAGFNYTNLTLARSLSRAKEVGVRKVTGALRHQILAQFICEAVVVALLGLTLGFTLLKLMQQFLHMPWIIWEADNNLILWLVFVTFTFFTGIIAGTVPAYLLSNFQPVNVLKGNVNPASFGKVSLKKGLIVIQLVVTCCFLVFITSFYRQFKYMATDNENFNRKNIYNITVTGNYKLIQNELAQQKEVERIGLVSTPFGGTSANCTVKKTEVSEAVNASYYAANAAFITNMNLKLIAGSNIPESTADSVSNFVLLNEQALYTLGLGSPYESIGKQIVLNDKQVIVAGVLKNFCYYIYQFGSNPLIMQYNPSQFQVLSVKVKDQMAASALKAAWLPIWKRHFRYQEFAFSDYEKELYERYNPSADMGFMGFASLSIFIISILGLIGMVTYDTEKRIKEIGIRRVLGASVTNVVRKLSSGYLNLLFIAACISTPLGLIIAYQVSQSFVFNNGVNMGLTIVLFGMVFLIALLVVVVQTAQAAFTNPVKSLRTE